MFSRLEEMVRDLDCIAAGRRCDSSDSQSVATVPSFAEALEADTEPGMPDDETEMDIRRDFNPSVEGFEGLPHLVSLINADPGIAKGDIMISLLNNDKCRVNDAVWRCRLMRQYSDVDWLEKKASRRSSSFSFLPNVDENNEAGGIHDVVQLEQAVFNSLKFDDFDVAFELCSDIYHKYIEYEVEIQHDAELVEKFQLYKATAAYNLGIVHLLRGDIDEALMCHETAVHLRTGCSDNKDSDYAVSVDLAFLGKLWTHRSIVQTLLNKSAACRFAAGDYVAALSEMEEALLLAREELVSLDDYRQLAEILNNLGCLSYIGGKVDRAALYFDESLALHAKVTSKSMYLGSRYSSHAAVLNASITKANLGFLLLVTQKPTLSVGMLEVALRVRTRSGGMLSLSNETIDRTKRFYFLALMSRSYRRWII
jgi:tetratricopeptide (TPR) repeat protein